MKHFSILISLTLAACTGGILEDSHGNALTGEWSDYNVVFQSTSGGTLYGVGVDPFDGSWGFDPYPINSHDRDLGQNTPYRRAQALPEGTYNVWVSYGNPCPDFYLETWRTATPINLRYVGNYQENANENIQYQVFNTRLEDYGYSGPTEINPNQPDPTLKLAPVYTSMPGCSEKDLGHHVDSLGQGYELIECGCSWLPPQEAHKYRVSAY